MKISEHWLREWVDPDVDTQALGEQLTMAGLEVDGIDRVAPPLENVLVAKVLEKSRHPDADKLSLCVVDAGGAEPLKIVCGAANVKPGGVYPVATIGAVLPGDFKIKRSKIRGQESFGMLCSAVELGIAESAAGLLELDESLQPGLPINDALGLDDRVIDLDLTPNRADCFSILGTAREVAAINGLDFTEPAIAPVAPVVDDSLPISLQAGDECPAFAGRVIRGVDATAQTPLWMVEKLRRSGIRPISPVVDVTNFVMLELGQPMHAYDLARLSGGMVARMATKGERLTLLDEREIELDTDVLVIADQNQAVALAGIMGGAATAVDDTTRDIFLESAYFSPSVLAGRARRYGLHTDASLRFERGVDYTGQIRAIERATELLLAIVGGQPGPVTEERIAAGVPGRDAVLLRSSRLAKMLGIEIADAEICSMLERLGFAVAAVADGWLVTPPSFRFDIAIEEDLVEEVVRLYGYDKVPEARQKATPMLSRQTENRVPGERARDLLVDRGYQEAITYSFVDPRLQTELLGKGDDLELQNPLSAEQSVMRRSLWPGLLQALQANRKRQQSSVRLFEMGVRFARRAEAAQESNVLAGVAWGAVEPEHWDGKNRSADFFDIKSDVEAVLHLTGARESFKFVAAEHSALRPGRTAKLLRNGSEAGWCGELHPRLARKWGLNPAPQFFELNAQIALEARPPRFSGLSRFPSVRRDLALIVAESVSAADLISAAREAAGKLIRDVRIFDIYTGDGIENGLKSVALGLILQETSRTLTELEIDGAVGAVIERLSSEFNASIRE
jgi:phenylalanyl-tRNA synthetase beta chain